LKKSAVIGVLILFLVSVMLAYAIETSPAEAAVSCEGNCKVASAADAKVNTTEEIMPVLAEAPAVLPAAEPKSVCGSCDKAKAAIIWVGSRDYLSAAKNLAQSVLHASIWVKLLLIAALLIILLIIWNNLIKDSRANNLRRARRHHLLGEKAHAKGNEKSATKHYEKAEKLRQKAQEQW
jgi:hypothetical protein